MDKYEKLLDRIAEEYFRRERMEEAKEQFQRIFTLDTRMIADLPDLG